MNPLFRLCFWFNATIFKFHQNNNNNNNGNGNGNYNNNKENMRMKMKFQADSYKYLSKQIIASPKIKKKISKKTGV